MQVTLTPDAEEILNQQLAKRAGEAPEQIIERALERLALDEAERLLDQGERRPQAVADMQAFADRHQLTLNRQGRRLREFMHEGHKY